MKLPLFQHLVQEHLQLLDFSRLGKIVRMMSLDDQLNLKRGRHPLGGQVHASKPAVSSRIEMPSRLSSEDAYMDSGIMGLHTTLWALC